MSTECENSIIEPSLFKFVTEYAGELRTNSVNLRRPLRGDNKLIVFAENFLAQFARGYLGQFIIGFNQRSQRQLIAARRRLESEKSADGKTDAAQLLIFHLEPLCDRIPEISYGNSEYDAEEFHIDYFADLLDRIVGWLEELPASVTLKTTASNALKTYLSAIEQG